MAQMSLLDLRGLVRDLVQESSAQPLTDAIIDDLLNEGQDDLAVRTEYKFGKFIIAGGLLFAQKDYALPPNIFTVYSVAVQDAAPTGNLRSLGPPTTMQQMDENRSSWRTDTTGQPTQWWVTKDIIWLHPAPSLDWNGTPFEIYGTMLPPDLVNDSDIPAALPEYFNRTLARYAAWQWLIEDKDNATALRVASYWEKRYMYDVNRFKDFLEGRHAMDDPRPRVSVGRDTSDGFGFQSNARIFWDE